MSRSLLHELLNPLNIQSAKHFVVQTGLKTLSKWLREQMEARNWSTYDVARETGRYKVSNGTVWNVLNERVGEVKDNTLRGLAFAFKVSDDTVFDIYRVKKSPKQDTQARFAELALKFDRLPDDKKVNGEALIELLDREFDRLAR
jgi:transcriptional regulator with XRE-family HTH domain